MVADPPSDHESGERLTLAAEALRDIEGMLSQLHLANGEADSLRERILNRLDVVRDCINHSRPTASRSGLAGRVKSSVDGLLEVIAHRGSTIEAGVREQGTGRYVACRLDARRWRDELHKRDLWGRRVIVYGSVAYGTDGQAVDVDRVTKIEAIQGRPLRALRETESDITGNLETDDFVEKLRGYG